MRHIDKNLNLEEGNKCSSDFLCDAFNEDAKEFRPPISSKQAYVPRSIATEMRTTEDLSHCW